MDGVVGCLVEILNAKPASKRYEIFIQKLGPLLEGHSYEAYRTETDDDLDATAHGVAQGVAQSVAQSVAQGVAQGVALRKRPASTAAV